MEMEDYRHKLLKRLRYIEGQARGVQKMVREQRDDSDILIQLMAIRSAAQKACELIFRDRVRQTVRAQLREKLLACPGACDYCDDILALVDEMDLTEAMKGFERSLIE